MSDNLLRSERRTSDPFAIHSAIVDDKFVVTIHAPRMSTLDDLSIEYGTSPTHDIYRGEDCIIITSPCLTLRDS